MTDALNTDVVHWFMASVDAWNRLMPLSEMTGVSLETDGMDTPAMNEEQLREFWSEWEFKLPYDWGWLKKRERE